MAQNDVFDASKVRKMNSFFIESLYFDKNKAYNLLLSRKWSNFADDL